MPIPAHDDHTSSSTMSSSPQDSTDPPFPPLTCSHILHCSYSYWHPLYKHITPRAALIPLTPPFLSYLRSDGIVLPPSRPSSPSSFSSSSSFSSLPDPTQSFPALHTTITTAIASLGGCVVPKLNWCAPKDATWISTTNSMACRSASDVYLLLQASDDVAHDLEHAFEGCVDSVEGGGGELGELRELASRAELSEPSEPPEPSELPNSSAHYADADVNYTLVLRKHFALNPALEFRCFVRNKQLLAISQRDITYYSFLLPMAAQLQRLILAFYENELSGFAEESFVLDVYVPHPDPDGTEGTETDGRVWLIDINAWAARTDPLLFAWEELLALDDHDGDEPEVRLVHADGPGAYAFSARSATRKMPREVMDAGLGGAGGIKEFAERWRGVVRGDEDGDDEDEGAAGG